MSETNSLKQLGSCGELKEKAKDLLEKAGKATPGKWYYDSYSKVFSTACDTREDNDFFVAQVPVVAGDTGTAKGMRDAEYIAAASPDVIAALARSFLEQAERLEKLEAAHLEAVEALQEVASMRVSVFVPWESVDGERGEELKIEQRETQQSRKARTWLAAWGAAPNVVRREGEGGEK